MEKGKKVLLSIGAGTLAIAGVFALALQNTKSDSFFARADAVALNTLTFEVRNEGGAYSSTESQGEGGLKLEVTNGDYQGWKYGLVNWSFPTIAEQDYYCEFVMTLNVSGWEVGGANYSEIVLMCNEGGGDGYRGANYCKNFIKDVEFTVGQTFKASGAATAINLQLGGLRDADEHNAFTATIKKFVMKTGSNVGPIVNRINFESGAAFANRWKAAHDANDFCDVDANVAEELIYDYSALYPAERTAMASILESDGETLVKDSVDYFAERLHIALE